LRGGTAQLIANESRCVLPTRRLVDEIYAHAEEKLTASPMPFRSEQPQFWAMPEAFLEHDRRIKDKRGHVRLDVLVAGHKKDLVVSAKMEESIDQLILYGWQIDNSRVLQPLSSLHPDQHTDYSIGVRLISDRMLLDGKSVMWKDVLKDPATAELLSDEGAFRYRGYAH
jgi:hypothetical protein